MPSRGSILSFSPTDSTAALDTLTPLSSEVADTTPADTLAAIVRIICHSGMDPVTQLAGYLMTDDPTYLPESDHARLLADRIGRDKLLETLIELYLKANDLPTAPTETRA